MSVRLSVCFFACLIVRFSFASMPVFFFVNNLHIQAGSENIRRLWSAWLSTHQTSDWSEHAVCWVGCWVEFCCTLGCVLGCVLGWARVAKSFLTPKMARISSRCPCMHKNQPRADQAQAAGPLCASMTVRWPEPLGWQCWLPLPCTRCLNCRLAPCLVQHFRAGQSPVRCAPSLRLA